MKILVVELVGPDFLIEARTVARNLKLHAIGELRVQLGHTSPESPNVKAAVKSLKHHLRPNAAVLFITTTSGSEGPSTPSRQTTLARSEASVQTYILTKQQAGLMQKDLPQKQPKLQTKTFEVTQDITVNRARTPPNKVYDDYIRG